MDPSYNNFVGNAGNASGVNGGVNSGAVAGGAAGATAGGATQPNSAMPQQPIASGSDDIVIAPNQKSSRRGWMIGLVVVLAVAVIGGIVAGVVVANNRSEPLTARTAFNKYANYMLYGINSTENVTVNYGDDTGIYYYEVLENPELTRTTVATMVDLYENFKALSSELMANNEYLNNTATQYEAQLKLMNIQYSGSNDLTLAGITEEYINNGVAAAEKFIVNGMQIYSNLANIYGLSYHDAILNWSEETLNLIKYYDELGCVNAAGVDYVCAAEKYNSEAAAISQKNSDAAYIMNVIMSGSRDDIYWTLFSLRDAIYNQGSNNA